MARWPGENDDYSNNDHNNNECQERDHGYVCESAGVQADEEAGGQSQPQEATQVWTTLLLLYFVSTLFINFSGG